MKKNYLFNVVLFLCLGGMLFAGGRRDFDERSVEKTESWQESFDIQDKKEGKYNIMVTAEDEGGNVSDSGSI